MAKPYSNREQDQFFKAADERADAFHSKLMARMDDFEHNTSDALVRIEEQTKKTNGSVASLKMWRAYMTGALAIISFFLAVVVIPVAIVLLSAGRL